MIDKIKEELSKESPDWLLISNMALEIHNSSLESNFFRFKKGKLNVIRSSEYNCDNVLEAIQGSMNTDEYEYLLVGSWKGMTVTKYNSMIDKLSEIMHDKFVVIVTCKDQVTSNSLKKGLMINQYSATLRNKYDKNKPTTIQIKGDGFELSCKLDDFKQHVRDLKLEDILG